MQRTIEPEWLDGLPSNHPDAAASRKDLERINRIMGNCRAIAKAFHQAQTLPAMPALVEIGAGDGTLLLRLVQKLALPPNTKVILVDQSMVVSHATRQDYARIGCDLETVTADVLDWLTQATLPETSCVVANLFLHHFAEPQLRQILMRAASKCALFIACEPRRSRLALVGSHLIGLIGCNNVTRHDAVISVHAGFTGKELSALWPREPSWSLTEHSAPPFSHCFTARKTSPNTIP